jgi:hypothetical protein
MLQAILEYVGFIIVVIKLFLVLISRMRDDNKKQSLTYIIDNLFF